MTGSPIVNSQTLVNAELHLTPGEPMIAGGMGKAGLHAYTVIRAEVLSD